MGDRIGGILIVVALVVIILWFINGFWIECVVTDPEYLEWRTSP